MTERADNFMATLGRGTGAEIYRVGGSVRDEICGRRAKDADYMVRGVDLDTLKAALWQVDRPRARTVRPLTLRDGRQAGFRLSGVGVGLIEMVLPRREEPRDALPGESLHRAFDIVSDPSVTLKDDAQRRDFTFNALYRIVYHPDGLRTMQALPNGDLMENVIDPTGRGVEDLLRRRVSTTHEDSFRDDPLRTLRALRFVSTLGYDLDHGTLVQMYAHGRDVDGLAGKEMSGLVVQEMTKIITGGGAARALRIARDTGVLGSLGLPVEQDDYRGFEMLSRAEAPRDVEIAWAHLFRRQTPQEWRRQAKAMHVGAEVREHVVYLMSQDPAMRVTGKYHASSTRRMRVKHGDKRLLQLIALRAARLHSMNQLKRPYQDRLLRIAEDQQVARDYKVPAHTSDLHVNGHDVIRALGAAGKDKHGRVIGQILNGILDEVVREPTKQHMDLAWQEARLAELVEES